MEQPTPETSAIEHPGPSETSALTTPKPKIYVPETLPEGTENPRAAYLAKKEAIKKRRQEQIKMMTERRNIKIKQRAIIREKVEKGLPITPEERDLVNWTASQTKKQKEEKILEQVASLTIRPQNMEALRLVVEKTAAKYNYNPIEGLIKLTQSPDLDDKEKGAIHKALLPFLVPQLPAVKERQETDEKDKIRVTISQFVIPDHSSHRPDKPLHEERPAVLTVETPK